MGHVNIHVYGTQFFVNELVLSFIGLAKNGIILGVKEMANFCIKYEATRKTRQNLIDCHLSLISRNCRGYALIFLLLPIKKNIIHFGNHFFIQLFRWIIYIRKKKSYLDFFFFWSDTFTFHSYIVMNILIYSKGIENFSIC